MRMPAKSRCRRFTIGDGMILIAATAAAMAWCARAWPVFSGRVANSGRTYWSLWEWVDVVAAMAVPFLLAWTPALLALRLREPRPSWRRTTRQPGTTASVSALIGAALTGSIFAGLVAASSVIAKNPWAEISRNLSADLLDGAAGFAPIVGFGVILGWSLLAIQGGWRSEPSWIDRAGRGLGLLWILAGSVLGAIAFRSYI